MYLDFGVCAVGHSYQQSVRVENRGKVPLKFTIADPKEASFTISTGFALLEPKESAVVNVLFNPATINRFMSSLLVECKGIHYKEVALVGVGGSLKFEVIPTAMNIGKIPYNLQTFHSLSLVNLGDVVVEVDFSEMLERQSVEREGCSFTIPGPMRVGPGRSAKCIFGITVHNQGTFCSSILLKTKENTMAIPVTGSSILISLGALNRQLLQHEQLPAVG
jgi:hypothetical protein